MPSLRISHWMTQVCLSALLVVCTPVAMAELRPIAADESLRQAFGNREVVFAARTVGDRVLHAFSPDRIEERHAPFSTFKIPNFLVALETGAVADAQAVRDWDPARRPASDFWPASWQQAQSLVTAFRRSAVWFFRDIAQAVGGERYRTVLARLDYGNAVAADGNDGFWLDGSLRIAPIEQIAFLERLLTDDAGFDAAHVEALAAASLLDDSEGCRFHGKTGAGPVGENFGGPFEGWLVGWTDCDGVDPVVYALWVRGESFAAIRSFRRQAATELLRRIGALDTQGATGHEQS